MPVKKFFSYMCFIILSTASCKNYGLDFPSIIKRSVKKLFHMFQLNSIQLSDILLPCKFDQESFTIFPFSGLLTRFQIEIEKLKQSIFCGRPRAIYRTKKFKKFAFVKAPPNFVKKNWKKTLPRTFCLRPIFQIGTSRPSYARESWYSKNILFYLTWKSLCVTL